MKIVQTNCTGNNIEINTKTPTAEVYIRELIRLSEKDHLKTGEAYLHYQGVCRCLNCIYADSGQCNWRSDALKIVAASIGKEAMCFGGILQSVYKENITHLVEKTYESPENLKDTFDKIVVFAKSCYENIEKPYSEEIKTNVNGVNAKIKASILPDAEMRRIGFTNHHEPNWYFCRMLNDDISFSVTIPKDGSDIRIDVLDENFCQPYDYQAMLNRNPNHKFALDIRDGVEKWMEYLQEKGILKGHKKYDYI